MHKKIGQMALSVILIVTFMLSACKPEPEQMDPALAEQTLQAAMAATLTAAPTSTPQPTATATLTPTVTPTQKPVIYGPTNFPENVNPLTGLEVDDPTILDRRPVMVKVADQAAGRPHSGLSDADIVFDYYIGNGLDRFLALYYGDDSSQVGTVRSGRYVDIPLVQMYQGILAMVSAYKPELDQINYMLGWRLINAEHCDENFKAVCDDGRNTETSVFANTSEMSKLYESRDSESNVRQNLDGMYFSTIPPAGGVTTAQFTMHYGKSINHQWIYDPSTHKYLQWMDGYDFNGKEAMIPLVDRNNNLQLAFSNVVVIFVETETLNGDEDSIHASHFIGKNRAIIFRDGQMYDVYYRYTWNQPFSFYDAEGNPFALRPGNTWIHLTGVSSQVVEDPAGIWTVNMRIP